MEGLVEEPQLRIYTVGYQKSRSRTNDCGNISVMLRDIEDKLTCYVQGVSLSVNYASFVHLDCFDEAGTFLHDRLNVDISN